MFTCFVAGTDKGWRFQVSTVGGAGNGIAGPKKVTGRRRESLHLGPSAHRNAPRPAIFRRGNGNIMLEILETPRFVHRQCLRFSVADPTRTLRSWPKEHRPSLEIRHLRQWSGDARPRFLHGVWCRRVQNPTLSGKNPSHVIAQRAVPVDISVGCDRFDAQFLPNSGTDVSRLAITA